DAAEVAGRQPLAGESRPGGPAVARPIEAAAGAAADQGPGRAPYLPERREDDLRVLRVEGHVDGAGVGVLEEHLLPRLPTVDGAEHAPLGVGPEGVAEGGDEGDVGVARVDRDPADLPRVGEAEEAPGAPGVVGAVDALAVGDVAADAGLAGADIDDVGVRLGHRERAHREVRLVVEERGPGGAAVVGAEDAARDRAEGEGERLAAGPADGERPAAAEGADRPPAHGAEDLLGDLGYGGGGDEDRSEDGETHAASWQSRAVSQALARPANPVRRPNSGMPDRTPSRNRGISSTCALASSLLGAAACDLEISSWRAPARGPF